MTDYDKESRRLFNIAGHAQMEAVQAENEGRLGDARKARERDRIYTEAALDAYKSKSWWYRTFGW